MTETNCETTCDAAALMARQSLYRFAALSLLDPKAGSWEQLKAQCEDALLYEAAGIVCNLPRSQTEKAGAR